MARLIIVAAALAAVLPSGLEAYTLTGYAWAANRVEFRINPNFPDVDRAGTPEEQIETLRCAAEVWRGQSRARFELQYAGTSGRNRLNPDSPGNALFHGDADGQEAVAATLISGDRATGVADSFDVIFFARSFGDPNLFRGRGEPGPGEYDLGGVATHELGHVLGLGHTPELEATMFASIRRQALELRTLDVDDREGAESLYGLRQQALPPVVIESITPSNGTWDGGNEVVIAGSNLTYTSDTRLFLDDDELPRSLWQVESCSRLRIPAMPAHAPGFVDVRVSNSLGSATATAGYRFGAPVPRLLGIEPAEGPIGGGIAVTVTGENLTSFATILVAGKPLIDAVRSSESAIAGTLPPGSAPGPADVRLVQGDDEALLPDGLTYNPYVLEAPVLGASPGAAGLHLVFTATTPQPLSSASFAFTYTSALLSVASITVAGTAAAAAEFAGADIDDAAGVVTIGIVMDLDGESIRFPAGAALPLARASASVAPAAVVGVEIPLSIRDGAGEPPIELTFTRAGDPARIRPFPLAGKVVIVEGRSFRRGDANGDKGVNITDPIFHLDFLFQGGPAGPCEDAADSNDDGRLDLSDAVTTLRFLFQGDTVIPPPSPDPGLDPTEDTLRCEG